MRAALLLAAAALAPWTAAAQDRPEAARLLRRVMESAATIRLQGMREVVLPGGRRMRERVMRDGMKFRIEVLEPPEAQGHVAVEDRAGRRQFNPQRNEIRILPSVEAEFLHRLRSHAVRGMRGLAVKGGSEVAGKATRLLEISGPAGRVHQRLWIEPASGAVLKSEVLGDGGQPLASFEYVRVTFTPEFDAGTFVLDKPGATVITPLDDLRRIAREFRTPPYRIAETDGWRLVSVHPVGEPRQRAFLQSYVNADLRVSLFQVVGRDLDQRRVRNLVGPDARVHKVERGEVRLYVVGELDQAALERLAQRIQA